MTAVPAPPAAFPGTAQGNGAAARHGITGIADKVLEHPFQVIRISLNFKRVIGHLKLQLIAFAELILELDNDRSEKTLQVDMPVIKQLFSSQCEKFGD